MIYWKRNVTRSFKRDNKKSNKRGTPMIELHVGGLKPDFNTITEAINSVKTPDKQDYAEEVVIHIAAGTYYEKIYSEEIDNLTLIGEGRDKTIITYDDHALQIMPDGIKRGTFRSYTAFLSGHKVTVKDLTIENTSGDGRLVGQALALYSDADSAYYENVCLKACQDTLFMSPLPVSERQPGGFTGPRENTERKLTNQYFKDCKIIGDIDFIFGGADAVFDNCDIICNDREHVNLGIADDSKDKDQIGTTEKFINGYITAPCGSKDNIGFIFRKCLIQGAKGCASGSVFLGRPWREEAKAAFIDCVMDDTIHEKRFSGWGGITKDQPDTAFGEYNSVDANGNQYDLSCKNNWVMDIDERLYLEYESKAEHIISKI